MGRLSIRQEVERALKDQGRIAYGRSKHQDKLRDRADMLRAGDSADKMASRQKFYFYNRGTYDVYVRKAVAVCKYANSIAGHRLSFHEVEKYLEKYLDMRKEAALRGEITPRTLAKERSQLSKVWQVNLDHYKILPCHAESDKGRGKDRHWNPANHQEAISFYKMVGARKAEYRDLSLREANAYRDQVYKLTGMTPEADLHGRISNLMPIFGKDGLIRSVIIIKAKHGKTNISTVLPQHRRELTEIFKTGKYRDYFNPSDHFNVHQTRREKSQEMYRHYARDITSLPASELYICRGRYRGRIYDRQAVAIVAESLGHSRRDLFDTIHNYLR